MSWDGLIRVALDHGVAPLLYLRTRERPVPDAARAELRQIYRANLARNLAMDRERETLQAQLLEDAGPVVPLKGPRLATLLYGDPGARQVADLDFLIRPENLAAADRALVRLGYRRSEQSPLGRFQGCRDVFYSRELPDGSGLCLDLHMRLRPYGLTDALVEQIWRDGMSSENLLLYLCLNLLVHRFARLQPLLDIVALLEKEQGLDWDLIGARARELEWTAGVFHGLTFAAGLAGAALPIQVSPALRPGGITLVWVAAILGPDADSLLARSALLDGPYGTLAILGCENGFLPKLRLARAILFPAASTLRQMDARGTNLPLPLHYAERAVRKATQIVKAMLAVPRGR